MVRYASLHRRSLDDPEGFWGEAAGLLTWERPWDRVLDRDAEPAARWFTGGRLSTCYNALDRHVEAGCGDRTALIHVPIGRASFEEKQLLDNLSHLMDNIVRARPSGVKGQYIRAAYLTTTMGPSIKMDVASASALKVE